MNLDSYLNKYSIGTISILAILALTITGLSGSGNVESPDSIQNVDATVYKSPNCGCCTAWAQYAERQGMNVDIEQVRNLDQVKDEQGVPSQLESCHTTVLDDYVVEGHVPIDAVGQLLEEEPEVQGIGMPGMPQGSPGMPGPKQNEWTISSFTEDGQLSEFMTV